MYRNLLLLGLIILLGACTTPEISTPAPTPQAVLVTYPSALKLWADKLAGCAADNPRVALYFSPTPGNPPDIFSDQITLSLGQPDQVDDASKLWQVGYEQVIVLINQENILTELSESELTGLFSGTTLFWDNDTTRPVQVWITLQADPTWSIVAREILGNNKISSNAMLAPDPDAMLAAVAGNPNAIGYLPGSILANDSAYSESVKTVKLETSLESRLTQPVVAITPAEPAGLVRDLLVCLQSP